MAKPKIAGLAEINLDDEEITPPAATGQVIHSVTPKPGRKPRPDPVEPFQLRIPPAAAHEIRLEAVMRRMTHSDLLMEAWALWKREHGR